jgi:hypothetical protein
MHYYMIRVKVWVQGKFVKHPIKQTNKSFFLTPTSSPHRKVWITPPTELSVLVVSKQRKNLRHPACYKQLQSGGANADPGYPR